MLYENSFEVEGKWVNRSVARSWVLSFPTHVKRVSQHSAESRGFSPGAPVSSHRES